MKISIQIGIGEALDRLSILDIKREKLSGESQKIADKQYRKLLFLLEDAGVDLVESEGYGQLLDVNRILWDLENDIREEVENLEEDNDFEHFMIIIDNFVKAAKSIPYYNDQRFKIKQQIDSDYGSGINEVKSI